MTIQLDPAVVEQIREVGGEELVRDLFETFIDNAGARLEALRSARRAGDLAAIAHTAHSVRSAAASIGAAELAAAAAAAERPARAGDTAAVAAAAELESAIVGAVGGLRLLLERRPRGGGA